MNSMGILEARPCRLPLSGVDGKDTVSWLLLLDMMRRESDLVGRGRLVRRARRAKRTTKLRCRVFRSPLLVLSPPKGFPKRGRTKKIARPRSSAECRPPPKRSETDACARLDAQGMKRNEKPKPTPFYMGDPAHQNRSDTQHRSS